MTCEGENEWTACETLDDSRRQRDESSRSLSPSFLLLPHESRSARQKERERHDTLRRQEMLSLPPLMPTFLPRSLSAVPSVLLSSPPARRLPLPSFFSLLVILIITAKLIVSPLFLLRSIPLYPLSLSLSSLSSPDFSPLNAALLSCHSPSLALLVRWSASASFLRREDQD